MYEKYKLSRTMSETELMKTHQSYKIFDFEDPLFTQLVTKRDDSDIGGFSRVNFNYNEKEESLEVMGEVVTEDIEKVQSTPYSGIGIDFVQGIPMYHNNALRVKFKGDGNRYLIQVIHSSASLIGGYAKVRYKFFSILYIKNNI